MILEKLLTLKTFKNLIQFYLFLVTIGKNGLMMKHYKNLRKMDFTPQNFKLRMENFMIKLTLSQ